MIADDAPTMRRMMLLLLFGVVIGLATGLMVGWVALPVQPVDSPMRDLAQHFKDDYTIMVAQAFLVDGDLSAAVERLRPLETGNVFQYVRDVTERYISQSGSGDTTDIRKLVALSCAMQYCTPPMQPFIVPPALPTSNAATGS